VVQVYTVQESAWRGTHQKVRELIRRELLGKNGGNGGLSEMP
jgi:hypothetical protein